MVSGKKRVEKEIGLTYLVYIQKRASADILSAISYYNRQQAGLGDKFLAAVDKHIGIISKNPFFQIRYMNVRCLPIKKYPFMIHFVVDEKNNNVYILSVLHTAQDPSSFPVL